MLPTTASSLSRDGSGVIEFHLHGNVAELVIARPDAANALNNATYDALSAAFARCGGDQSIDAVVLTARGERAFSAGADLKDHAELPRAEAALKRRQALVAMLDQALAFPKPLIAAIQAPAVGAGAMLACTCDELIAADGAWFNFPEVALDMPSPIGIAIVGQRIGPLLLQRLFQRGERVDAETLLACGLIAEIAMPASLLDRALTRARERAAMPRHAQAVNKAWINRPLRTLLREAAEVATAADTTTDDDATAAACPTTAAIAAHATTAADAIKEPT